MGAVVLHRVGLLAYSCLKQGQDFKPSAAPLYPNLGQVAPPLPPGDLLYLLGLFGLASAVNLRNNGRPVELH